MTTPTKLHLTPQHQLLIDAAQDTLSKDDAVGRIWGRDPTAFTPKAAHKASILNRLGWLTSPDLMLEKAAEIARFATEMREAGFRRVLLLGMGGSSLCPEVLAKSAAPSAGGLELRILDSTDPAAVLTATAWATLGETLFVVSSKSGGTIELRSFAAHFWKLASDRFGADAGQHFVAITDPGSPLSELAKQKGYRRTFENPSDIGGRFSAISYFGLVPAALLGIDVLEFAKRAQSMARACGAKTPVAANPGATLGVFMGALAKAGRNKLTLLTSPELSSLGSWVEQLVAESTGKDGVGVVPIDLEPPGDTQLYGADRAFVCVRLASGKNAALDEQVQSLAASGHPVTTIDVGEPVDLGAEFFRWEFGTAIAGAWLGVNPFDEPNVTEAKTATGALLTRYAQEGKLTEPVAVGPDSKSIGEQLKSAKAGHYIVLSAYVEQTPERDAAFEKIRTTLREKTGLASTLGFGPRFLHSTGQLHKGGPKTGVFLVLTADVARDVPIPGEGYSFETLRNAQAFGDIEVLAAHGLTHLRVHLGANVEAGLQTLARTLEGL